ncbi:MAG: hypothetical protein AB1752_01915 [Candidatus Zixiibacteriota bacterium]
MRSLTRITAAAIFLITLAGCQTSDSTTQTTAPESNSATSPGPELLTLADVQAKIALNDEATTKMTAALDKWRQGNELALLDRAMGKGHGPWMGGDAEPPVHTFLMESATFLSTDEMVTLVNLIAEERQERFKQFAENRRGMRDGGGPQHGWRGFDGAGHRFLEDLNLTDDQKQAIEKAHDALRDEFEPGERRSNVRDAMHEKLKEILTPEQLAILESKHSERRSETAEHMQERVESTADRRIEFLSTVLKLSDDQKAQVQQIWQSSAEERQALRKSFVDDSAERGEMRGKMQSFRDEATTSVRAVLTADQAKLFDALEDMRPMRRFGRGNRAG